MNNADLALADYVALVLLSFEGDEREEAFDLSMIAYGDAVADIYGLGIGRDDISMQDDLTSDFVAHVFVAMEQRIERGEASGDKAIRQCFRRLRQHQQILAEKVAVLETLHGLVSERFPP